MFRARAHGASEGAAETLNVEDLLIVMESVSPLPQSLLILSQLFFS